MSMIFRYRSMVGTFVICPQTRGCYELHLGDRVLESYRTPEAAAADVCSRTTGCLDWDGSWEIHDIPRDLSDWEQWQVGRL